MREDFSRGEASCDAERHRRTAGNANTLTENANNKSDIYFRGLECIIFFVLLNMLETGK